MSELRPVKVSFSFYPSDTALLAVLVSALKKAGVKVRSATVLRALIHLTAPGEMIAHAVRLAGESALRTAEVNTESISDHPTVDLPKGDVKKLDGVVAHLARAKIIATRAYVVRAILRAAPDGKKLAPSVRKFLEDFPNKPRGLSKIRLERQAKANGRPTMTPEQSRSDSSNSFARGAGIHDPGRVSTATLRSATAADD